MSCPIVIKTIDSLEEKGIYEHDTSRVLNKPAFIAYNDKWSQIAKDKFNLTNVDKMFNVVDGGLKKMLSGSSYLRDNKESITRAFVNQDFFNELQEKYDLANKPADTTVNRIKEVNKEKKIEVKPGVSELFDSNPELANQVYKVLGLKKTFTGYNVSNLLNEVIDNSKNKDLVYVAKLLNSKDFIGRLNILEKKLNTLGENQVLFAEKNIISNVYVDSNKIKNSSTSFEEVVLHELIHRYTSFIGISKQLQIPIRKEEEEFYKDMSAAYTIYTEKGFEDLGLDEFVAQSLTNKKVINNLKSIKINNTDLFEKIINFVKKLINKQINTLFDFTSTSITNYINNLEDTIIENYYSESEATSQQKQQAQQLYSQYLDTIFPDSKVKDIVYHGSTNNDKQFFKKSTRVTGHYFATTPKEALQHAERQLTNLKDATLYNILLNIKNPRIITKVVDYEDLDTEVKFTKGDEVFGYNADGIIAEKVEEYNTTYKTPESTWVEKQIIVFEPEQIHILGSKQDIEGFKKFMKNTNKQNNTKIELNTDFDIDKLSDDLNLDKDCK